MKNKETYKTFIFSYFWILLIAAVFIYYFPGVWHRPSIIYIYLKQAAVWFPVISGILMLACCKEVNIAVGEQIAFGVCLSGFLKSRFHLPVVFILVMVLVSTVAITILFCWVYHLCRAKFIWISIVFQMFYLEINAYVKMHIIPEGNEIKESFWGMIGIILICSVGIFLYLNHTVPGRMISFYYIVDAERIKCGAFIVSSLLTSMTALLYFIRSGSTTMVQGEYIGYTLLQVLGICGVYRLSRRNLLLRAAMGSIVFVMLHAIEQIWGFGSREDIMISGVLFLWAVWQMSDHTKYLMDGEKKE